MVANSGLTLEQMVAWYLYVLTQKGIDVETRPGYMVNRAREGEAPPADFQLLASLTWELWRCYACLLELPPLYHQYLENAPGYTVWMAQYSQAQADALPFGVGQGVYEFMELMQYGDEPETADTAIPSGASPKLNRGRALILTLPSDTERVHWQATLGELELQMTKATFNTWLKDARLLGQDEGGYIIGVRNESAQAWLTNRLHGMIVRTLASIMQERVQLRFEVWNPDTDSIQPAA